MYKINKIRKINGEASPKELQNGNEVQHHELKFYASEFIFFYAKDQFYIFNKNNYYCNSTDALTKTTNSSQRRVELHLATQSLFWSIDSLGAPVSQGVWGRKHCRSHYMGRKFIQDQRKDRVSNIQASIEIQDHHFTSDFRNVKYIKVHVN